MSATTLNPDDAEDRAALHRKMDAEIAKLVAETAKINAEARAYPWLPLATAIMGSTGVIGAVVAILIAFHR